jgi:hypothetical protein
VILPDANDDTSSAEGAGSIRAGLGSIVAFGLIAIFFGAGCTRSAEQPDFVARVGQQYLLAEDVSAAMESLPAGQDSAEARRQLVEQWVTQTLLEQEARRRGLEAEEDVKRQLYESERSVLVSTLVSRLYEEEPIRPSTDDVRRYFELHRDRLRLREPYVRVRYLNAAVRDSVNLARRLLQRAARTSSADSLWRGIVNRFATDVDASMALADRHFPESRLFPQFPEVREMVGRLRDAEISQVIASGDFFHVVQVINRRQPGDLPEIEWIETEIEREIVLEQRKQIFARRVQDLRNQALARKQLDVR